MKAITKDGRIVDVSLYQEEKWYNKDNSSEVFSPSELDFVDDNYSKVDEIGKDCKEKQAELPDTSVRNNLRLQIATAAMQGLLNAISTRHIKPSLIARDAVKYTDALLMECGLIKKKRDEDGKEAETETKLTGIIIEGKVYEAIPRGSYHCNDCDLFNKCRLDRQFTSLCIKMCDLCHDNIIFIFSEEHKII